MANRFSQASLRQRGLTLVELMVALTIGLFIAAFVGGIYLASARSARYQEAMARLQENARFAMETMSRSVRNTGYLGCGAVSKFANVVNGGRNNWWLNLERPIVGFEGGISTLPAEITSPASDPNVPLSVVKPAIDGSDAFISVSLDDSEELSVISHDPIGGQINTVAHSIQPGNIAIITDCNHTALFQVSGPSNTSSIEHNIGTAKPGNCQKELGANCGAPILQNYTFRPGATIMQLSSNAFYIGEASAGNSHSLWTVSLGVNKNNGDLITPATELVQGVDDMQILYGEDTDKDGYPNRYISADAVTDWPAIVSLQISLLMSTIEDGMASSPQTYEFNGQSITAKDRRVRRTYTSVINLRNRSN